MERTVASDTSSLTVGDGESSSPQPSNTGLSLLERIDRVLGKKRGISTSRGKSANERINLDTDSEIEDDDINLLECAKIVRLSNLARDSEQHRRAVNELAVSNSVTHLSSDSEASCSISSEQRHLTAKARQVNYKEKLENEPTKTNSNVASCFAPKPVPMECLSFSKGKSKVMADYSKNVLRQAIKERDTEKTENRMTKNYEKQAKNQAKQEEKQRRIEEREARKKRKDHERNARKAVTMTARAESIDECLKYMTAVIDSDALTDGGGAMLQSLEAMGVQYEVKKLPCDSTIGWMRDRVVFSAEEDGQIKRKSTYEEEDQILLRIKAADLARMMNSDSTVSSIASRDTVAAHISKLERLLPNKKITIVVTGMGNYSKLVKAHSTSKKQRPASLPAISQSELENTLLELQFQYDCCVHFCENADELAHFVCSFTKAVAEKPYKKLHGTAFNIYMESHEKGLPQVSKDGRGLVDVWVKQLQQFKGVGYDTAAAIVQRYPSPYLLVQEYHKCTSSSDAGLLLQDIEVRRGHGVLATCRRVGPELSKKIYALLTSLDGFAELAKS